MSLPIDYSAVIRSPNGVEGAVDLESAGWRDRDDVKRAEVFSLQPKPDAPFANVVMHLDPFPDGTKKELVYFSRVHGSIGITAPGTISPAGTDLFRLYCLGWKAEIAGRIIEMRLWAYPGGSVVCAHEPPYVDMLIQHYLRKNLPHMNSIDDALRAVGVTPPPEKAISA